jgi:hypothetical protein
MIQCSAISFVPVDLYLQLIKIMPMRCENRTERNFKVHVPITDYIRGTPTPVYYGLEELHGTLSTTGLSMSPLPQF